MKKICCGLAVMGLLSLLLPDLIYCASSGPKHDTVRATAIDIDKDGQADVVYYYDNENITMAEADTNKDGMPDVRVYAEKGKFKSAEADTDYDGKADKEFGTVSDFSAWLKQNNPEYEDYLNRPNWKKTMFSF